MMHSQVLQNDLWLKTMTSFIHGLHEWLLIKRVALNDLSMFRFIYNIYIFCGPYCPVSIYSIFQILAIYFSVLLMWVCWLVLHCLSLDRRRRLVSRRSLGSSHCPKKHLSPNSFCKHLYWSQFLIRKEHYNIVKTITHTQNISLKKHKTSSQVLMLVIIWQSWDTSL